MSKSWINRKYLSVAWVSFSSGLPLLLVGSTLQAWFTVANVDLMSIGLLSLVGLPYLLKFLWSPLVDRISWGRLGRRRGWILLMQILLAIGLLTMSFLSPSRHGFMMGIIALLVALFSATQDIAVDAYRTDVLSTAERGHGSSITNIAYRAAMMVASFMALIMAAKTSWQWTYVFMAVLMLLLAAGARFMVEPKVKKQAPQSLKAAVLQPFKNFLHRFGAKQALCLLLFVIFYRFADALALSLNTTFLLRGMHFSLLTVGSVAKITSTVSVLLGSVLAGFLIPKMGLYRSLWWFGWLQLISILGFCVLSLVGHDVITMAIVMFADFFCGGLGSVAFVVLLMALCDQRFSATQYAILSALASVTRVVMGPVAANIVTHFGWLDFYLLSFFLGVPVMALLFVMRKKIDRIEKTSAESARVGVDKMPAA